MIYINIYILYKSNYIGIQLNVCNCKNMNIFSLSLIFNLDPTIIYHGYTVEIQCSKYIYISLI